MSVNDLDLEKITTIKAINCDEILKNRLYSFGIIEGTHITVTAKSLAKKTIEIKINQSKVALRHSEANKIEVN
ncbi:FeoA family protein [Aliarcobacter lanthieri]|uniref:FeoA family protein n=1 Tax=Arcobacteraceae TaxID=2808963 RepID=UPI000DEB0D44|nr:MULTISPECIES: FeoA family protein [Arcobacteraceae]MBL3519045.1 ferrous iron transport protein A [Aliarcobacter lanthieri]RBQ26853.1 iron transporter [Arcobacter sp. CECT 9188]